MLKAILMAGPEWNTAWKAAPVLDLGFRGCRHTVKNTVRRAALGIPADQIRIRPVSLFAIDAGHPAWRAPGRSTTP
nr:hypothetical protein [uncultured Achromobacter sp.]